MNEIVSQLNSLKNIIAEVSENKNFANTISEVISIIVKAFNDKNKILFCGNGGSAAEAQHLAAELSGKFKLDRKALPAEACHLNPSFLTAVSNDYSFAKTYERHIEAFGKKGDILIGLTTSGNSENIINAFQKANETGITTVALTGMDGGKITNHSDFIICVPSNNVPRIQEVHLLIGHIICEAVEKAIFGDKT